MCEPITLGAVAGLASGYGLAGATIAGTVITPLMATVIGTTVGAGVMSAASSYQQGQVSKQIANNNAKMAEYAATDAQRRGEIEAQQIQRKASQLSGTQRSLMAARGLDLSTGTPSEITDQTDFFAQSDIGTARYNAAQDAWAYRAEAQDQRSQGSWSARNANTQAFSSLLSTTGSVADKWMTYSRRGP